MSKDHPPHTKPDPVLDVRKRELLGQPRVFAVVGMSPKPGRIANEVALYLREHGHTVIPVHPKAEQIEGLKAYPNLHAIESDTSVDVVDLFVAPERTPPVVEQAAQIGAKTVWFQPGAEHEPAEDKARELGLEVFSGVCPKAEHSRLFGS